MNIKFNGNTYVATYNEQTGYYELELTAPNTGGVYQADIEYINILGEIATAQKDIQILAKPTIEIHQNKTFMWIFSFQDFSVKDCIEIPQYEINMDEETNATSTFVVLKQTEAKARDIIAIKKDGGIVYWGTIEEIQKEGEGIKYTYTAKYITNLFDRFIKLGNSQVVRTTGLEDFISNEISSNFTNSTDSFINIDWLDVEVKTHTPKETSVTNVDNGIYNLHTWMTNCTQNYNIVYQFEIVNNRLKMSITNQEPTKELIDVNAQPISGYEEVFETDVVAKVSVLYSKVNDQEQAGEYTLYLKTDRTTTTNMNDPDRADGKVTTIYTENYEDANQSALDEMKSNTYNHNITFNYLDRYIPIGTPIAIKTKESAIYDTYISAVTITTSKFYQYTCGNIRVKFIDKLLKEKK